MYNNISLAKNYSKIAFSYFTITFPEKCVLFNYCKTVENIHNNFNFERK